jgi:hypothetical protein
MLGKPILEVASAAKGPATPTTLAGNARSPERNQTIGGVEVQAESNGFGRALISRHPSGLRRGFSSERSLIKHQSAARDRLPSRSGTTARRTDVAWIRAGSAPEQERSSPRPMLRSKRMLPFSAEPIQRGGARSWRPPRVSALISGLSEWSNKIPSQPLLSPRAVQPQLCGSIVRMLSRALGEQLPNAPATSRVTLVCWLRRRTIFPLTADQRRAFRVVVICQYDRRV